MKIVLILLSVFLFFMPSMSFGEKWIHVGGDRYIDGDSIVCEENICRAWTFFTPSILGKEGVRGFEIYDCREKKFGLLQLIRYGPSGDVLFRYDYTSNLRWTYIVPETIEEKKATIICGRRK